MKGDNYFIDTNIFICTIDEFGGEKSKIATTLIKEKSLSNTLTVSFQVVQEFVNACLRKSIPGKAIEKYLKAVIFPSWDIYPSRVLYLKALEIHQQFHFTYYDSMIIAAALEGNCHTVYTEDLQHKQKIETLTIIDPFANLTLSDE